jgi:hypothetical protein
MVVELGPVLRFESRQVARRKSWYVLRIVFVAAVMGLLALFQQALLLNVNRGTAESLARQVLTPAIVWNLIVFQQVIAFVIAPIDAAFAFSRIRIRPMLTTLLASGMSPRRIVVWETDDSPF